MYSKSYNLGDKKIKQINTLKVFNQNVTEKVPGEEYCVESPNRDFQLHVKLPANFPDEKPCMHVVPPLPHSWVDEKSGEVTSAPGMLNFTEHSDLGRVVHAIVRELSRMPAATIGSPPSAPSTAPIHQPQVFSDQNEQSMLRSALASLSVAQLHALKESEDHCDEFLEQLPPIKILEDEIERIMSENVQMANDALLQEGRLNELKQMIKDKVEKVHALNHSYEEMSLSYKQISDKFTPAAIKEGLHNAALECDQQSDKLAEKFLEGEIEIDPFLSNYISARTMSHNRRIREEKLGKQLLDLEKAGY